MLMSLEDARVMSYHFALHFDSSMQRVVNLGFVDFGCFSSDSSSASASSFINVTVIAVTTIPATSA